jgi:tRNA(fMet)-specific endonuclease VapC
MTGNNVLLDTSVVIDLFKGDQAVLSALEQQREIYIAAAVLGELYLGAYRSVHAQKKMQQINDFLIMCTVLSVDQNTAEKYAIIKTSLLSKGKPIPENDIWIAATAMQYNLLLYTMDSHFREIQTISLL